VAVGGNSASIDVSGYQSGTWPDVVLTVTRTGYKPGSASTYVLVS